MHATKMYHSVISLSQTYGQMYRYMGMNVCSCRFTIHACQIIALYTRPVQAATIQENSADSPLLGLKCVLEYYFISYHMHMLSDTCD